MNTLRGHLNEGRARNFKSCEGGMNFFDFLFLC